MANTGKRPATSNPRPHSQTSAGKKKAVAGGEGGVRRAAKRKKQRKQTKRKRRWKDDEEEEADDGANSHVDLCHVGEADETSKSSDSSESSESSEEDDDGGSANNRRFKTVDYSGEEGAPASGADDGEADGRVAAGAASVSQRPGEPLACVNFVRGTKGQLI